MCVVPLPKNKAVGFIELSNAELKYIYITAVLHSAQCLPADSCSLHRLDYYVQFLVSDKSLCRLDYYVQFSVSDESMSSVVDEMSGPGL